ncbi:50S ribosomal protein L6 [Devosia sp. J2-20]|jgi:large subunit ribosomal protein L6|uniref:Large ribosomal subunit protein uL6 n=1 Tax=Devosia litorisediminis TaxID=2829817 RepID=A0A942E9N4_9HYPH|nr:MULTISPECIES: 50S ribosomal protein L6 [Devosia]MBS3848127.1 50S ribosomal protein L6 [Devosia litorisediminis]MCZ4345361.1 50S ribosomal protein L6 [Devosia neptuniae]WDQ98773.1 50S ribosomal protein L6 [Devosia sp. J2-20]|tara:strand:- start:2756 stop:3289 length:534 start_codon:yes stop_codon:yes gene_type:complete
MSRTGKQPVAPVSGVTVTIDGRTVTAKGPKGELSIVLMDVVNVENGADGVVVSPANDTRFARAAWGTTRALIQNMVTGVSAGFEKKLAIQGVGYRAALQGKDIKLSLGFSHEVIYEAPKGITLTVPVPTEIVVTGIDKQQVGQVAAEIRAWRKPEPYKGKGVRYAGEYVFRKEGKKK